MKNMILAVMLVVVSFSANAGGKYWTVTVDSDNYVAATTTGESFAVKVIFDHTQGCHGAALGVYGIEDVKAMSLRVDGKLFRGSEVHAAGYTEADASPVAGVVLSDAALSALKKGSKAVLHTNNSVLDLNLEGSAKALNKAWILCEIASGNGFKSL